MKVLIMTDLEGISGVDCMEMIFDAGSEKNRFACRRLMADVNAAAAGCLDAGADEIYVVDGHGGANNFIPELLHPAAVQLRGSAWEDLIRSGECAAYLEVGCHAMPGTLNGFLDHCQSSKSWYNYLVNGRRCGEIAQGALFAGAFGVPFVMVSGDDAACTEARAFLGNIETASVKTGVGRNHARCIPFHEAESRIRTAARDGVLRRREIRPYRVNLPLELVLELYRTDMCDDLCAAHPELERIDARSVRKITREIASYRDVLPY
ncbi:MAG: M55 family metallopeptidase [Clostridiaceae bacterium]|nr:M55 family metallopeptidase [Clostridiaceae bacterium]